MRVLVLWADQHSRNLGVRVLAQGTAALARTALGTQVDLEFQDFGAGSEGGVSFGGRSAAKDFLRTGGPLKARLRQFDVVLDTGAGDSFTDIYGLKRLAVMANVRRVARQLDLPVIMTPQTVGPFGGYVGSRIARRAVEDVSILMVRDPQSAACAARLGARAVVETTDVVFALPRPTATASRGVVINASGLLAVPNAHVDSEQYLTSVRGLIDNLLLRGESVTLLAHVLDSPAADNDVPVIGRLAKEYGDHVDILVPQGLDEVRRFLASAKLVVGSRMHACLNALSVGTPAVAWAYSRKFEPLMADLGWPHVIDLRASGDPVTETLSILDAAREETFAGQVNNVVTQAAARLTAARNALQLASAGV